MRVGKVNLQLEVGWRKDRRDLEKIIKEGEMQMKNREQGNEIGKKNVWERTRSMDETTMKLAWRIMLQRIIRVWSGKRQ